MATATYTINTILESLGYSDPMAAARQQARMILLGRAARYQSEIQQLKSKWGTLDQLQAQYQREKAEDFDADDAYLQWKWYAEAAATVDAQLEALAA